MLERGQIDRTDSVRQGRTGLWRPYEEMFESSSNGDSVATAVEPTWYFRTLGEEFGPYTLDELREFIAQDQLGRKDKVREGRNAPWSRAKDIPGLFRSRAEENRNLLSDFSLLEDAEPEPDDAEPAAAPVRKPVPGRTKPGGSKRKSSRSDPDEDLAAELLGPPIDDATARPASRTVAPPVQDRSPSVEEPVRETTPEPAASTPPAPRYTPPPPPPRSYSSKSSSSGGGGGFSLPGIDFTGTPVKVVGGIVALLVVGYFLSTLGFLGSMNAGPVYDQLGPLYSEFKTASEKPGTPEYQTFYTKFKEAQKGMIEKLGTPDPGTQAREVKNAVLTLGSAVEAYQRTDMKKDEREIYKTAADKAMDGLKQSFGR